MYPGLHVAEHPDKPAGFERRVTHSQVVPTMLVRTLKLPVEERMGHDVSSLRRIVHAAAPCPVEIKRQTIEWLGPIVDEYYAATEGNGLTYLNLGAASCRTWPEP